MGNCCTHGAGIAGQFAAHPRTRVATGYEPRAQRAGELQQAMRAPLAASYEAVVDHAQVEILALATDPCDKAEMVELAARAGKALWINKPLCHNPAAARRIEEQVQAAGIPAVFDVPMVKFQPAFDKLLHQVRAGLYGEVVSYYHTFGMTFAPDFPIRDTWPERFDPAATAGGGEMTNMGCYAIDYALHLLGVPPPGGSALAEVLATLCRGRCGELWPDLSRLRPLLGRVGRGQTGRRGTAGSAQRLDR